MHRSVFIRPQVRTLLCIKHGDKWNYDICVRQIFKRSQHRGAVYVVVGANPVEADDDFLRMYLRNFMQQTPNAICAGSRTQRKLKRRASLIEF